MEEKALASVELHNIGKLITKRLRDKASNARKNAMSFMAEFVQTNQFACQVCLKTVFIIFTLIFVIKLYC